MALKLAAGSIAQGYGGSDWAGMVVCMCWRGLRAWLGAFVTLGSEQIMFRAPAVILIGVAPGPAAGPSVLIVGKGAAAATLHTWVGFPPVRRWLQAFKLQSCCPGWTSPPLLCSRNKRLHCTYSVCVTMARSAEGVKRTEVGGGRWQWEGERESHAACITVLASGRLCG